MLAPASFSIWLAGGDRRSISWMRSEFEWLDQEVTGAHGQGAQFGFRRNVAGKK